MPAEVGPEDAISRCLIYPTFFNERNVHADAKLWAFGKEGPDGASHHSAVLRRIAINLADVHDIGCGIAAAQNERDLAAQKARPKRYYCGCRTAVVKTLPLQGEDYRIVLTNDEEGGIKAHVDVALYLDPSLTTKSARNQSRTSAGLALAEQFGAADCHTCECDRQDAEHPFKRGIRVELEGDYPPTVAKIPKADPVEIARTDQNYSFFE